MRFITVVAAAIILVLGLAVAPVAADPIHVAAKAGDVAEVTKLLASGVKVDARDESGKTPLHWATTSEMAKILLKAGATVDARGQYGWTPLHWTRTAEKAKVLLKAGATVDARGQYGWTPLHAAAGFWGVPVVVELLLKAGANAKARDKDGKTPFDLAKIIGTLKGTDAYWKLNDAQYD